MRKYIIALIMLLITALAAWGAVKKTDPSMMWLGISPSQSWTGLSTDSKPSTAVNQGAGFLETDTGKIYFYNGTSWILKKSGVFADSNMVKLTADSLIMKYIARTKKDTITVQPDFTAKATSSIVDTLTAPGWFKPVSTTGYSQITFCFTDSLVATSATIQLLGKVAGVAPIDWFNLDADSDSLVLLGANGTWARTYNFIACVDSVRIKVVSEAGGVAGKFWAAVKMANPFK
jgi:hypothetical protein